MKSNLFVVVLTPDNKSVWAANLDRLLADAQRSLRSNEVVRPMIYLGVHSSARAADRHAAMQATSLGSSWWLVKGSAQAEVSMQEGHSL
jgi:hypothetical protein